MIYSYGIIQLLFNNCCLHVGMGGSGVATGDALGVVDPTGLISASINISFGKLNIDCRVDVTQPYTSTLYLYDNAQQECFFFFF